MSWTGAVTARGLRRSTPGPGRSRSGKARSRIRLQPMGSPWTATGRWLRAARLTNGSEAPGRMGSRPECRAACTLRLVAAGKIPDPEVRAQRRHRARAELQDLVAQAHLSRAPAREGAAAGLRRRRHPRAPSGSTASSSATTRGCSAGRSSTSARCLRDENTLIVKLDPAPGDPKAWNNPDWRKTVVFNNVWGWHYSSIPALGHLAVGAARGGSQGRASTTLSWPPATRARASWTWWPTCDGPPRAGAANSSGTIEPDNFAGETFRFAESVEIAGRGPEAVHLRFHVPRPAALVAE